MGILVDWHNLAWFLQITSWDDYFYDLAARNSIDVGEFVGRCLAGVIQQQELVHCISLATALVPTWWARLGELLTKLPDKRFPGSQVLTLPDPGLSMDPLWTPFLS